MTERTQLASDNEEVKLQSVLAWLQDQRHRVSKTCIFLHAAKSGGSTIASHVSHDANWIVVRYEAINVGKAPDFNQVRPGCNIFIHFVHTTYDDVATLVEFMNMNAISLDGLFLTLREPRQRIISAFNDYWTQVERAKSDIKDENEDPRIQQKQENYLRDSVHYLDGQGNIRVLAWLKAFERHGSGFPFFYREMFSDSLDLLHTALFTHRMKLIDFSSMNDVLKNLTGSAPEVRRRVSHKFLDPSQTFPSPVEEILTRLSSRDAEFYDCLRRAYAAQQETVA